MQTTLISVSRHDDVRVQDKMTYENIGSTPPICCTMTEKGETRLLGGIICAAQYDHIKR